MSCFYLSSSSSSFFPILTDLLLLLPLLLPSHFCGSIKYLVRRDEKQGVYMSWVAWNTDGGNRNSTLILDSGVCRVVE
jgi:hypothetical protein